MNLIDLNYIDIIQFPVRLKYYLIGERFYKMMKAVYINENIQKSDLTWKTLSEDMR